MDEQHVWGTCTKGKKKYLNIYTDTEDFREQYGIETRTFHFRMNR